MPEVLVEFDALLTDNSGCRYRARACGDEMPDGLWQGWIEFIPIGDGAAVRSGRETTQPNREHALYWATGLTPVFLEGSLHRALNPLTRPPAREVAPPLFDGPAPLPRVAAAPVEGVLNPFSVYRKGEDLLRRQLGALSGWHLVNIITAYRLSDRDPALLAGMQPRMLAEVIINGVRGADSRPS
jgi:hypothetical protein